MAPWATAAWEVSQAIATPIIAAAGVFVAYQQTTGRHNTSNRAIRTALHNFCFSKASPARKIGWLSKRQEALKGEAVTVRQGIERHRLTDT
jgi:hypothetical protein